MDYEKLFNLFVGKDDVRPELNQPFKKGGKYCATDAHSLIFISEEKANLNFPEQDKPSIETVIPKEDTCYIEIKVSEIESQLIPDMIDEEIEGEEIECDECEGEGEVEWSFGIYDRMDDCPACGGSGTIQESRTKKTGNKIPNELKGFEMLGVGFRYKELRRLLDAAKIIEAETIIKTNGEINTANLFTVGDFKILVMPCLYNDFNNITHISLKEAGVGIPN